MIFDQPKTSPKHYADQAAASAEAVIEAAARKGSEALEALSAGVQELHDQATPLLHRGSKQISALTQRGMDAMREGSQQVRRKAHQAGDATVGYIRDEPVKAIAIAAAAGAALVLLLGLLTRTRQD